MARTLVGRYELEAPLGSGAFGEVWRGRDLATRQLVAVKLVELAAIDDPARLTETIARFRLEASVVARLRHPNIVAALEAGRVGSELFMVMELAEGIAVSGMLAQRRANGLGLFPVDTVLRIAQQACAGLAAAHSAGVVHRDIKPSNLMMSARGDVKIIDFGIARLLEDNAPRLTAPSETIGTLLYMSPEQAIGRDVDGRSDLYSFGCVLYELLAGRPPFMADHPAALMRMHVQERPVPLKAIRSDLPAGLAELVGQMMENDPNDRPADAATALRGLAVMSARLGSDAPQHEADRRTALAGGVLPEADRWTTRDWPGRGAPGEGTGPTGPEADRATVLAGDERAAWQAPFPQQAYPEAARPEAAYPQPPDPRQATPEQPTAPSGAGSRRAGSRRKDKGGNGTGSRGDGAPPGWPTARPRRRRSRWPGVLSSVITFAIIAGVAFYLWQKTHDTFKVTAVAVAVANPPAVGKCNVSVQVTGTIFTNGKGGPITYQWVRDGQQIPVATVNAEGGKDAVRVTLTWQFKGQGTHRAVAVLNVFTPNSVPGQSASFTYSCAS